MNICLDSYGILNLPGTFIASYSSEITEQLSQTEYPYIVHGIIEGNRENLPFNPTSWCITPDIYLDRRNNNYQSLKSYLEEENIKIFHSLNNGFSLPEENICSYVSTIHSLYPLHHKEMVDNSYYKKFNSLLPKALEKSNKIIAVSPFIKKELMNSFNIPSHKIEVIYPLLSKRMRPIPSGECRDLLAAKYGIAGDFIYYSGNIHKSKNLMELLRIFKDVTTKAPKVKLIISGSIGGKKEEYYKELMALISKLSLDDRVIFTGLIPKEDMVYFYNRARCTISLSDYDGYPLTLVEASACMTPVICLSTEINMDVLKDTAVTCDLQKPKEISDVISYICSSREIRSHIINKMKPAKTGTISEYIEFYENIQK